MTKSLKLVLHEIFYSLAHQTKIVLHAQNFSKFFVLSYFNTTLCKRVVSYSHASLVFLFFICTKTPTVSLIQVHVSSKVAFFFFTNILTFR